TRLTPRTPPSHDLARAKPLADSRPAAGGSGGDGVGQTPSTPARRDAGHWIDDSGVRAFVRGICFDSGRTHRNGGRTARLQLQLVSVRRYLAETRLGARSPHGDHAGDGHVRRVAHLHL